MNVSSRKTPLPKNRYIIDEIRSALKEKMVFLGGPRQVGKTSLCRHLLGAEPGDDHPGYLNWDIREHRAAILRGDLPTKEPLIVLDEIHKFARWRQLVKGLFDRFHPKMQVLVTGSARLDHYRKGGDSLVGRYRYFRLHPYSLPELRQHHDSRSLKDLLNFSGFPDPLMARDEKAWRIWQRDRVSLVIRDDLQDLERVMEVTLLEMLMEALPNKVGSPLSLQSLREDLQVSHDSIRKWLQIFENLYLTYRISPYGAPRIRAVKKEQKLYFWDWTQAEEPGPRLENLVASHLLKYCNFLEDTEGWKMELRFIRDTDKREVDFVVLQNRKPLFAVECKTGEKLVSKSAIYFRERTPIPKFYQVHMGSRDFGDESIDVRVLPLETFLKIETLE